MAMPPKCGISFPWTFRKITDVELFVTPTDHTYKLASPFQGAVGPSRPTGKPVALERTTATARTSRFPVMTACCLRLVKVLFSRVELRVLIQCQGT